MPKKVVNDYIKYQQTKDHLIFNSPELSVPKQVLYVNKKGDKKLINTLTKSGKLSTRENKSALQLKTNDSKNKIILNDGLTLYRRHLLTNNDIALKMEDFSIDLLIKETDFYHIQTYEDTVHELYFWLKDKVMN